MTGVDVRSGLFAATLLLTRAAMVHATPIEGDAHWQLVWHDEFDGASVDADNWNVLTRRNNHNSELQYYLPEQADIVDGKLRITATNEPFGGRLYRSARLESRATWRYGRFEVRAKIPTTKGIWPAAWLFPDGVAWPTGGEIDIMEHAGSQPTIISSAYHWGAAPNLNATLAQPYSATDAHGEPIVWAEDFHDYAVEWEPGKIVFFVDGAAHFTVTSAQADISDTPMNFVLNIAVGGHFDGDPDGTTVFPQHMDVEYVRVFEPRHVPEPASAALLAAGAAGALARRRTTSPSLSGRG